MTPTHESFLDHPIIHAYVSLKAWGNLAQHADVVIAETRSRTAPGDQVMAVACRQADLETAVADALPDRQFTVFDPDAARVQASRARASERGVSNITFSAAEPGKLPAASGTCALLLLLYAMHRVEDLERAWGECFRALAPGGSVLVQDYVGPSGFAWPSTQAEAAERALRTLVPEIHRTHHSAVGSDLAARLRSEEDGLAPRSEEILPKCQEAGFEIAAFIGAGCGLLHPVLAGQIDTYDPSNWEHNHVLSGLCREEARLMQDGVLGDDFAMFVAVRPAEAG